MKRYGYLYEQIYDFENLYFAYLEARKDKRFRDEILKFSANLEENLIQIQNELIWKAYKVGRYREFYVHEPKKRLIMALPFKDRVVQWAIYRVLNPLFEKTYTEHSYACRIGRGTHQAAKKLQYWLRQIDRKPQKYYYLKMDISKYFYRVDHSIALKILRKKIKDKDVLWLMEEIIQSEDMAFGLPLGMEPGDCPKYMRLHDKGMPIGNLTSQLLANIYLNELDQFCKHKLQIKYFIRYMDDFIVLHHDKKYLHRLKVEIENFLNSELELHLNRKTCIRPTPVGIEFVGFRIWPTHMKLKKKTAKKMKRRLKYLQKAYGRNDVTFEDVNTCVQSYLGILQHCDSYYLKCSVLKNLTLIRGS
ncbi:RNA-directed DNA polymerase (Reverse transcriptase) [Alkaliphilus metalliredigens QYMF]|uniref:RNA-directed DNA polymerase (Reverse transcriptase) n=1 Tax=Alkaliphilus metalliredigens (strain QYMF) TaxID=293826 RepID=A6TR85_ALKMQ|nr:reverse transcriptase/maturase family protein [Alkaliphilus metalliredigens]ABR48703.1 RNA-directed DNA polymerase (Reverse transcriptase) [Alkaliphilus metalliredigens QYMF]